MTLLKSLVFSILVFLGGAGLAVAQNFPALFDVTGVAADDVLNVRERPDGHSPKIGALAYDQKSVEVLSLSEDGKWGLVNTDERSGWVAMRFLRRDDTATANLPANLVCTGTEPFWLVEFRNNGTATADWSPMGLTDEQQSVYSGFWSERPANRVTPSYAFILQQELTGSGIGARGIIRTEICSDGMSDRDYGYAIELILTGPENKFVSGCCSLGTN
jgi:uncharacterized membrane protein